MAGEKIDDARKERLERVAREVVRASAAGESEADSAADSPFLYARIRARIEEERRRREEGEGWLALFGVAWRAVPAMALVAVLAMALFLSSGANELASANAFGDEEALLGGGGDIEQIVFTDTPTSSNDEVLSTIIGEGENSR
jgi:anti-sigma factor RsiW